MQKKLLASHVAVSQAAGITIGIFALCVWKWPLGIDATAVASLPVVFWLGVAAGYSMFVLVAFAGEDQPFYNGWLTIVGSVLGWFLVVALARYFAETYLAIVVFSMVGTLSMVVCAAIYTARHS